MSNPSTHQSVLGEKSLNAIELRPPQRRTQPRRAQLDLFLGPQLRDRLSGPRRELGRLLRRLPKPLPDFVQVLRDEERLSERRQGERNGVGVGRSTAPVTKSDKGDLVVLANEVILDKLPGENSQLEARVVEEGVGVLEHVVLVRF